MDHGCPVTSLPETSGTSRGSAPDGFGRGKHPMINVLACSEMSALPVSDLLLQREKSGSVSDLPIRLELIETNQQTESHGESQCYRKRMKKRIMGMENEVYRF